MVGGASRNEFLNRLTREATGLEVFRGSAESSTVGNFAVQMAVLEGSRDATRGGGVCVCVCVCVKERERE